jgi:abequosyltransferase
LILSICIPTYNRKNFLKQSLIEIIKQAEEKGLLIEICISDNASTDGTEYMVREFKESNFVKIVFSQNDKNIGPDLNYLKSVDLASGAFCWFMGSDDVIAPNSLSRLLDIIKNCKSDIILFNRLDCDIEMKVFGKTKWNKFTEKSTFNLNKDTDLIRYFNNSQSLGAVFSYLSSIVFRREKWYQIEYDNLFTGTAYSHVFMLLSFKNHQSKLTVYPEYLVCCRHGNDHFSKDGFVKRFLIDIDGYLLLDKLFFVENSVVSRSFLNIMKREHKFFFLNFIKSKCDEETWKTILNKLKNYNYNNTMLYLITITPRFINVSLFRFSVILKKICRQSRLVSFFQR